MAVIIEEVQAQEPINNVNNLPVVQFDLSARQRRKHAARIALRDAVEQLKDQGQIGRNVSFVREGEDEPWLLRCTITSQDPAFEGIRNQMGIWRDDSEGDMIFETDETVYWIQHDRLNHTFRNFVEAYKDYLIA